MNAQLHDIFAVGDVVEMIPERSIPFGINLVGHCTVVEIQPGLEAWHPQTLIVRDSEGQIVLTKFHPKRQQRFSGWYFRKVNG